MRNYLVAAGVVLLFLSGWAVRGWRDDSINQAIAEATQKSREAASMAAAEQISKIQITNTTIQNKVVERIRTEVQYQECKHSPETFKLIQDAFK